MVGPIPSITDRSSRRPATDPLTALRSLTPRDRWLLDLLAEHQVLTTPQLCEVAFPTLDVAQRRLLKLVRLDVLDRFRWHTLFGSQTWHYTLGWVGEQLVAAQRGIDPPRLGAHRQRISRLAASPRLGHLLGVNGLFTALAAHARTHPETSLDTWWSEARCTARWTPFVRPDGCGRWTERTRTVEFFLEYDTGSEPLGKVVGKLPGYADLDSTGGTNAPALFWLPSTRRETNLHAAIAAAHLSVVVATASTEFAQTVPGGPAGPVWLTAPGRRRRTLAELGPTMPAGNVWASANNTAGIMADNW